MEPVLATELYVANEVLASVVLAARTTYSLLPYDKKFAAVKKVSGLWLVGLPKRPTSVASESTNILVSTGPQRNTPAIAPSVEDTAGVTVVKSISEKFTPGLT
jgi:hypothetical protein